MADGFIKGLKMSSNTKDSGQPRTTKSGRKLGGEPLSLAHKWDYESSRPERVGEIYGLVKIISPMIRVRTYEYKKYGRIYPGKREYVYVKCVQCGSKKWVMYGNIRRGISKGCRSCMQPKRFPTWLWMRMENKRQLCQNPKSDGWKHYGGRGIKFLFSTTTESCLWVLKNIGLKERTLEIDRIDNDGHYEPGNIRWSTRKQNCSHTRKNPIAPKVHRFRQLYPHVAYAENTLARFFRQGMSRKQIIKHWKESKRKPKCLSGISAMPDPFIASLCKEF